MENSEAAAPERPRRTGRPAEVLRAAWASALLALPFQIGFIVLTVVFSLLGLRTDMIVAVLLVPALWVPAIAQIVFRTVVPRALQLHFLIFMTAGPFAGSALGVYGYIPHWDKLVHFDSGIMLAWAGWLAVRRVEEHVDIVLPRWFSLTIGILTPMAFAAAWEICEFTSDHLFGTHAQNGNTDTMGDIIAATVGAVITLGFTLIWKWPRSVMPQALLSPERRPARTAAGAAHTE
ncbi:hypothetical protein HII28_12200 [Planctomonas sp. JC2975]|uniref:hypothetical protein n=1 Tax=Planctomonas sp. JC2975 TaxID=2729626 RepID=UPI0014737994|nr:hypothetical protein [Planctomonas sp. JC2975]NNC12635.1 hypothetical protein [Planctomonas sp. JC2975]